MASPSSSPAVLDPGALREAGAVTPGHAEEAARHLGRSSLPGTVFHLAGLAFVELGISGADGLPRAPVVTAFLGFVAIRLFGFYLTSRGLGSVRQRTSVLAVGAVGANLVWGVRAAAMQFHTGVSEQAIVMGIILCGLATGAMTAFAPSRWVQRGALGALFVPGLVGAVVGLDASSLAGLDALFLLYMLSQGNVAHRNYWQSIHATDALQRHAESAQRAAILADATTQQLRTEIAHRAQMEVELRQAQKLEAIGRLAAGIAHEINTPVQFVGDSCRFLGDGVAQLTGGLDDYRQVVISLAEGKMVAAVALAELDRIDAHRDVSYLRANLPPAGLRALDGLERVAKIVAATKAFAYPHRSERSLADVNQAIESVLIISNNETKYVADIETELGKLPAILCHSGELNQVILNIIVNAAHAIGEVVKLTGKRGVIHIATRADPGWIRIAIRDTGTGIPAEILDKIYEPFFTTKPVGVGTGQGLAIARSAIVDKHGGTISVASQLGVGTTFTISLPIVLAPSGDAN